MTLPTSADFLLFGAWDGTALAVLLLACGAVSRGVARLDRLRGAAFSKSERICRTVGAAFTGVGVLCLLASWSLIPHHRPSIWAAVSVVLTVLIIVGWYSTAMQMTQGRPPGRGS